MTGEELLAKLHQLETKAPPRSRREGTRGDQRADDP